MEIINKDNVKHFFYRICWFHKIIKQNYFGSWHLYKPENDIFEWIKKQNVNYPECRYWLEAHLLKDGENYHDFENNDSKPFKNIECFDIQIKKIKVIDVSQNHLETFLLI